MATYSSKLSLFVSIAASTASAILAACFSLKTERNVSNTFSDVEWIKPVMRMRRASMTRREREPNPSFYLRLRIWILKS